MNTGVVSSRIRGFIDRRLRPLILLQGEGNTTFLAMVDTGFNAEMWCGDELAGDLNFMPTGVFRPVSTAGGGHVVELANGYIQWFGVRRSVVALVKAEEQKRNQDEPSALVGTALIRPDRLVLDFLEETLEISRS